MENAKKSAKNTTSTTSERDSRRRRIRENSHYNKEDQPAPDNNLFWEEASNPLSSKGN